MGVQTSRKCVLASAFQAQTVQHFPFKLNSFLSFGPFGFIALLRAWGLNHNQRIVQESNPSSNTQLFGAWALDPPPRCPPRIRGQEIDQILSWELSSLLSAQ
jgi:hypothetical protein